MNTLPWVAGVATRRIGGSSSAQATLATAIQECSAAIPDPVAAFACLGGGVGLAKLPML